MTRYVTSGGQQEGQLEQSEILLQTLCLPLDYLNLTRTDSQVAFLET